MSTMCTEVPPVESHGRRQFTIIWGEGEESCDGFFALMAVLPKEIRGNFPPITRREEWEPIHVITGWCQIHAAAGSSHAMEDWARQEHLRKWRRDQLGLRSV